MKKFFLFLICVLALNTCQKNSDEQFFNLAKKKDSNLPGHGVIIIPVTTEHYYDFVRKWPWGGETHFQFCEGKGVGCFVCILIPFNYLFCSTDQLKNMFPENSDNFPENYYSEALERYSTFFNQLNISKGTIQNINENLVDFYIINETVEEGTNNSNKFLTVFRNKKTRETIYVIPFELR
ncbi:MAG: hypothetical protein ACEPOW_02885 [Bacteroidales bacterium]